jgi:hypothetical protein
VLQVAQLPTQPTINMNNFLAPITYLLILISFLHNWLIVVTAGILFFSFKFGAGALIPLAVLMDGYFGNFYTVPYLSIFSIVWYIIISYTSNKVVNLKFG